MVRYRFRIKRKYTIATICILLILSVFLNKLPKSDPQLVRVVRVVDGDTIEISGGEKVRYIGINTPESVDPRKEVECFGKEAAVENKKLVEGKTVRLEKDVSDRDKYGRRLRYVYVDNIFVNDYLVANGFAQVATYPPDVKYTDLLFRSEAKARSEQVGLWSGCPINLKETPKNDTIR
jgi:micrococcal nuclease